MASEPYPATATEEAWKAAKTASLCDTCAQPKDISHLAVQAALAWPHKGELQIPVRAIPKILTVADWNAKKGVIAKMAGETGIGAALAKLKTDWDKVDWAEIDPDAAVTKHAKNGTMTSQALDQLEPIAKENIHKVEPVRNQLKAIVKLTGDIETKWKTSKVIPSSSRVHVGNMKTTADQLNIALKSIDNDWKYARERVNKEEARLKTQAWRPSNPISKRFGRMV
jgi:hypothetical protein